MQYSPPNRNTRGAGYIQVTFDYSHIAFLEFIGDDFRGEDTARYIAKHYPLEISVWYWTRKVYWDGGNNEFIDTKMQEGADPFLIFLKTAYYCAGMPNGINSDINDAMAGKSEYIISGNYLFINGNTYELPDRWPERIEAYKKAQEIW